MPQDVPMRHLLAPALLALVLTGCGGSGDDSDADDSPTPSATSTSAPEPVESSEPAVTPNASYGSVTDLRDAMVELGYPCPSWVQDDVLTFASSSGHCSDNDVFSVYLDAADLKSQVDALRSAGAFDEDNFGGPMLAGPNWLLNLEDIEEYREGMGGTVVAN